MNIKPIEWLPIEQMKVGDDGLLVTHDDSILAGELTENDLVRVYKINEITLQREDESTLIHISEFKLFFSVVSKIVIH